MSQGPVERAVRHRIVEGQVLHTPTQGKPFKAGRIDGKGVVLLLGRQGAQTRFTWPCLEGVVPFLQRHGGEVEIGGRYDTAPNRGTLDEHLKGFVNRATAGWVAALLQEAGVVELVEGRPAKLRLAGVAQ